MIEKILNGLGFYTEKQFDSVYRRFKELEGELMICKAAKVKLAFAIKASEEAKANAIKENEKLKNDYENVVAALKVCEDEKRAILVENDDLRRALENRKKQADLLLNDFERVSRENEKIKKELERLRLKVAKSVKRKKR